MSSAIGYEQLNRARNWALDFGAPGDGTDQTEALQALIDAQIIANRGEVVFPPGDYHITDSLYIAYPGDATKFVSLRLSGSTGFYYPNGIGATRIFADFTDRPAIVIQGARGVWIRDLQIEGKNEAAQDIYDAALAGGDQIPADPAEWVSVGCSSGRYNPYCAIAIDPYSGAQPGSDFYPGTYGAPTSSSHVTLENVTIWNFVVGIAIKPSDDNAMAEQTTIRNCLVRYCAYGVSIGNSQSRGTNIEDTFFWSCCTLTTGRSHGKQNGAAPMVRGGASILSYRLIDFNPGFGHSAWSDFYAETLEQIGHWGAGALSTTHVASFDRCHFKFHNLLAGVNDNDPPYHLAAYAPVAFRSCTFSLRGWMNVVGATTADVSFDGCSWLDVITTNGDIFYVGLNAAGAGPKVTTQNSAWRTSDYQESATNWNAADVDTTLAALPGRLDLSLHSRRVQGPRFNYAVANSSLATSRFGITANASGYSWVGSTVTFTASNGAEFAVGDKLFWRTAADPLLGSAQFTPIALVVTDVTSNTVTATALCGVQYLDTSYAPSAVTIAYRPYAHTAAVTGSTTSGSPSVTGVTSATTYFKIGDFIQGNGIPSKTRVTAVSGTTVTLSKNATATASNVYLYLDRVINTAFPVDSANNFGAAQDGSTDDAKPIMACLEFHGKCQLLGGSPYAIATIVDQPTNTLLYGSGMVNTTIRAAAGFLGPVVRPDAQATIRDMLVLGRDEATSVGIQPLSAGQGVLCDRVSVQDFATGVLLDNTGQANFTFANGRLESNANGLLCSAAISHVSVLDSVIQSNMTAGVNLASGNFTRVVGNIIGANGTGVIVSGSIGAPEISNQYSANTVADVSVTGNVRAGRFGGLFAGSPIGVAISNGTDCSLEGVFQTSGGLNKAWRITNAAATNWRIGPATYNTGEPDLLYASGDEIGTGTKHVPLLTGSQTIDVEEIPNEDSWSSNVIVPGARLEDPVVVTASPLLDHGAVLTGRVSAQDQVTIQIFNASGGNFNPQSTSFNLKIVK